ncbi:hypothetical protein [Amycolatopsis thailandensis]|uniref:hypothetical protein n=1 Tax=Amycolatopsis thailandensis TaxID=589330 RepID=UPI001ABF524C|nr:hypothetical protein [Amycolatopsis thailandensis]
MDEHALRDPRQHGRTSLALSAVRLVSLIRRLLVRWCVATILARDKAAGNDGGAATRL